MKKKYRIIKHTYKENCAVYYVEQLSPLWPFWSRCAHIYWFFEQYYPTKTNAFDTQQEAEEFAHGLAREGRSFWVVGEYEKVVKNLGWLP